jgi:hypothetical protein
VLGLEPLDVVVENAEQRCEIASGETVVRFLINAVLSAISAPRMRPDQGVNRALSSRATTSADAHWWRKSTGGHNVQQPLNGARPEP